MEEADFVHSSNCTDSEHPEPSRAFKCFQFSNLFCTCSTNAAFGKGQQKTKLCKNKTGKWINCKRNKH